MEKEGIVKESWKVTLESVYRRDRVERMSRAYELILSDTCFKKRSNRQGGKKWSHHELLFTQEYQAISK